MTIRRRLAELAIVAASIAVCVGCTGEEIPEICDRGAEVVDGCTGSSADFMDACLQDPKQADTLVSAACSQDKADGSFGWLPRGERCWFNFECVGEYVCRPTKLHIDVLGDHFCLEQGDEGNFCDSDGDCQAPLKCLDEHLYENGQCGFPN